MHVACRAEIVIPRPRAAVFDRAVAAEHFPAMLSRSGPIPGIVSVEIEGGALAPGARRHVTMTDGARITEEIVAFERPVVHGYRWRGGLQPPMSLLVRGARATWRFEEQAGATTVDWRYLFELTSPLAYPLAAPALLLFQRWMNKGLERLRAALLAAG